MYMPFKGPLSEANLGDHAQVTNDEGRIQRCSMFELNATECLEAYGIHKGRELCSKFFEDFQECRTGKMAELRRNIMMAEMYKKILKGEKKLKDRYLNTPWDSYVEGTFYP